MQTPAPELLQEESAAVSRDSSHAQSVQRSRSLSRRRRADARRGRSNDAQADADSGEMQAGPNDEHEESAAAVAARKAALAIFVEKQRLMGRNETIVSQNGLLARAPRSRDGSKVAGAVGTASRQLHTLAPSAEATHAASAHDFPAAKRVSVQFARKILFGAAAQADETEPAHQPTGAPWQAQAGDLRRCSATGEATTSQRVTAPAEAAMHPRSASAAHCTAAFQGVDVRSSDSSDCAGSESSQPEPGMCEYLFTACATGVVHKWALDEQLQSDQYQVRNFAWKTSKHLLLRMRFVWQSSLRSRVRVVTSLEKSFAEHGNV